jgi:phosphoribosylformimino-5-aminoimidazole carboxamide ribotide isomerase
MIAAPAIDLREGRCVQLVGGRPEEERISIPDPLIQARKWFELGFRTLHVVDLDAALDLGSNRALVREIAQATDATVQAGGGIRDASSIEALLAAGAARVIVGTRAVDEPDWLRRMAEEFPGSILVAADVRDGQVLRKGWTESSGIPLMDLLDRLEPLPLAGVLCTDVGREGRMAGADLVTGRGIVARTRHPVWISGGITSADELRALAGAGAAGAVLGMAIYTGVLSPAEVAKEFGG